MRISASSSLLTTAILESATLFDELSEYPTLSDAVSQEKKRLGRFVEEERDLQAARHRELYERFE
jgi:hypothetical protein